ncbi:MULTISPECIES: 16S rRNA (uracil(1498)-N(3))-methyltransferase [Exiguobacterium]|uniref:16S rRNA (uracil(1498)-N(3))-methyltransferase n=1 Tax=Exiguobacterium TaxID=33986 RepID=UPI001BE662D3|nr:MULTISPECIES: 16S rRNA (uracil(1498)-N(3))-methyltransferase [Exiguobacterium]MCT4776850.1 16S rRNA (uracil(1498)-N(3))-methyltransferase [Exiguobacterium aquaticum]MCT4788217.1 16S rRNA (uracil(1498)-N(3))-methyltransferase [Exiguobacterium mexicanum]
MQRYFLPRESFVNDTATLPADVVHHIGTVLRETPGYRMVLLDGTGLEYEAEVVTLEKKTGTARVLERRQATTELPVDVTLAYALPKGDKVELVAQKGTELGMHHFWVFESKRSVAKWDAKKAPKKVERLQKIMQEAAEQSYRAVVPSCQYVTPRELTERMNTFDAVVIAYEEDAKQGEKAALVKVLQTLQTPAKILFVVGPEGGFDEAEVAAWVEMGAIRCAFGPRILRSETAPLYALAALSYALELN